MNSFLYILAIGVAGAAGTLLRFGSYQLTDRFLGTGFPWGTLFVNVLGSFAFGAIWGVARARGTVPAGLTGFETVVLVGFLGGFTTYSTFAFQSLELLEAGRPFAAFALIAGTTFTALLAVWGGLQLFKA
ncbi:MAG: CrcB family protein [Planctomycetia bacterium]|nr:CrcB family protein [Planctomycetia bacterium]